MALKEFFESISLWGWFDLGFTFMVLVGVAGESDKIARIVARCLVKDKTQLGFKMISEWRAHKFKHIAERFVIWGIAGELVCLAFTFREGFQQALKIEELKKANLQLEIELASLAPLNQPIRSLTADVRFTIKGSRKMNPDRIVMESGHLTLDKWPEIVFHLESGTNNWKTYGNEKESDYFMEFRSVQFMDGTNLGKPVETIGKLERFSLNVFVLPLDAEITSGTIALIANGSSRWVFKIPSQKIDFVSIVGSIERSEQIENIKENTIIKSVNRGKTSN